jgi:FMN phosphatase YigB (HAD superfamily)
VTTKHTRAIALDFGGTLSTSRENHVIGQKGVDPQAAAALHDLARLGLRLILATNATAAETRWPALQLAGVHELFQVALISYSLNVRKDEPLFYDLVITAAQCPASEVLFVGNSIANDVAGPMRAGMRACLVRPGALRPGEHLPDGALLIGHIRELSALLEAG